MGVTSGDPSRIEPATHGVENFSHAPEFRLSSTVARLPRIVREFFRNSRSRRSAGAASMPLTWPSRGRAEERPRRLADFSGERQRHDHLILWAGGRSNGDELDTVFSLMSNLPKCGKIKAG